MPDRNNAPDPWLSEYFGTGNINKEASEEQVNSSDVEMIAAVQLLEKTASENGLDLSGIDPYEYSAEEILNTVDDLTKEAGGQEDPEVQEFVELHKFAGKIQAHAFASELDNLSKEARGIRGYARELGGRAQQAGRDLSERVGAGLISRSKRDAITGGAGSGALRNMENRPPGSTVSYGGMRRASAEEGDRQLAELARKRGRRAIGGAAAATGVAGGTGTYAATREKESADNSATERLVQERMYDMLKQAGYVDRGGNVLNPEQEKVSSEQILEAVDQEALNRLYEAGYR